MYYRATVDLLSLSSIILYSERYTYRIFYYGHVLLNARVFDE